MNILNQFQKKLRILKNKSPKAIRRVSVALYE